MDKLIEKIIEKTELKNWTLFLFIFAICYAKGLQIITGHWFHLPENDFDQTTLFLLEVFLSSLTITRFLVAIKFLEAINRTPIIADIINLIVVDRREVMKKYEHLKKDQIAGKEVGFWLLEYKDDITELEAWFLIHYNIIVEDEFPEYKKCKEAVIGKTCDECLKQRFAIVGYRVLKLNPALYRHLDKEKFGGFWIPKRPPCLEHFLTVAFILGSAYITGIVIRLFL